MLWDDAGETMTGFRFADRKITIEPALDAGRKQCILKTVGIRGRHPLADQLSEQDLKGFLATVEKLGAGNVAALEPHTAFVARCCKAGAAG